jgi:hypothetical protein
MTVTKKGEYESPEDFFESAENAQLPSAYIPD